MYVFERRRRYSFIVYLRQFKLIKLDTICIQIKLDTESSPHCWYTFINTRRKKSEMVNFRERPSPQHLYTKRRLMRNEKSIHWSINNDRNSFTFLQKQSVINQPQNIIRHQTEARNLGTGWSVFMDKNAITNILPIIQIKNKMLSQIHCYPQH